MPYRYFFSCFDYTMVSSKKWRLFLGFLIASSLRLDTASATQAIMKQLSVGFSKVLETCKNELTVGDHIIQDFYNFWKEDYQLVNRDFGCMLLCMASKHDLISEDMRIHHENAHAFAKTHGADDDTAKQLVTILHDCETQYLNIEDFCNRVVEVSKCFRTKIHDLKWAPDMEVILEEVMTSV